MYVDGLYVCYFPTFFLGPTSRRSYPAGQYFGETTMTTWIRTHAPDSSACAASTNPTPSSSSAPSSQAAHSQRDPLAGRLLSAQSAQAGTVVAVFSQAQAFVVGKLHPEVEGSMHSIVRCEQIQYSRTRAHRLFLETLWS